MVGERGTTDARRALHWTGARTEGNRLEVHGRPSATPEEVIERLRQYEKLGVDEFSFWCDLTHDEKRRSLGLFIKEVAPAFLRRRLLAQQIPGPAPRRRGDQPSRTAGRPTRRPGHPTPAGRVSDNAAADAYRLLHIDTGAADLAAAFRRCRCRSPVDSRASSALELGDGWGDDHAAVGGLDRHGPPL
jgi:hypothetical protein